MKKLLLLIIFPFLLGTKIERKQNNVICYKADIIFIIDYSGSMGTMIPYYEPWLRGTVRELPLSHQLKAGLLFFSDNVCGVSMCPLTEDKFLFDEKILEGKHCLSAGTYLEPALKKAKEMFTISEEERGEKVPQIVVVATDLDISDSVESCEFIYSEMENVFFIIMELDSIIDCSRIETLKTCFLHNGIVFEDFIWVYEDLLKQFDPCM